ncbi:chorismate--pyruvate lyase family protein [Kushneria phyllosphaerae]|uniref:Chorismate pyruvate-lyase n=1 Tax=Kushneria phyllosphaerae TaxID=2100822 RepID=A0A2R8CHJ6_9GAMM|nr:chorismate lyase [Kushneria phyllosphaerae]SPJ32343.1 Chorismate pyruvate-lyase [Kushneria phyllosphaerae]
MPESSRFSPSFTHWQPVALSGVYLEDPLRTLMDSRDSLTARLAHWAGAPITVRLHAQGPGRGRRDELAALGQKAGQRVWRREVTLEAEGEVLVAARSVMALKACPPWMTGLGTQALGHQLFARSARAPRKAIVQRSSLEMIRAAPGFLALPVTWGRRSLFALGVGRAPLLVQEYFVHERFTRCQRPSHVKGSTPRHFG